MSWASETCDIGTTKTIYFSSRIHYYLTLRKTGSFFIREKDLMLFCSGVGFKRLELRQHQQNNNKYPTRETNFENLKSKHVTIVM